MKEAAKKRGTGRKQDTARTADHMGESEVASASLITSIFARRYAAEAGAPPAAGGDREPEPKGPRRRD